MMRDINSEILTLLTRYHGDTKRILKENKKLEYLYALSPLRENVLEWFSFDPPGRCCSWAQISAP